MRRPRRNHTAAFKAKVDITYIPMKRGFVYLVAILAQIKSFNRVDRRLRKA